MTIRAPQIDRRMDDDLWEWTTADGIHLEQPAYLSSTFSELVKLFKIASKILTSVYDVHLEYRLFWKSAEISSIL